MPTTKIIIGTIKKSANNDWFNIVTNDGKEVSVNIPKCPKLTAKLNSAISGDEIEGNLVVKNDKIFMWDPNESSGAKGKTFTPADKSFDAAKTAALAVATLFANKADVATLPKVFETLHGLIMSKVTKPAESKEVSA